MPNNYKFLFIHTWGLGDLIMLTPALKALKEKYPTAQIDFLITVKAAAFPINKCSLIDNIYHCSNSFFKIGRASCRERV